MWLIKFMLFIEIVTKHFRNNNTKKYSLIFLVRLITDVDQHIGNTISILIYYKQTSVEGQLLTLTLNINTYYKFYIVNNYLIILQKKITQKSCC